MVVSFLIISRSFSNSFWDDRLKNVFYTWKTHFFRWLTKMSTNYTCLAILSKRKNESIMVLSKSPTNSRARGTNNPLPWFLKPHGIQNLGWTNVKLHNEPFKTGFRAREIFVSELLQIYQCECIPIYGHTSYLSAITR